MLKVSIITVCYNSESTILHNIKSVNKQSYENIEHIFIDGKSSDKTIKIIRENCSVNHQIISEEDEGIYNAMNKGLKYANGEIVGFLNSDDSLINDNAISAIVKAFKPNVQCVYGNLVYLDANNKVVRKWHSREFKPGLFKYSWTPAHPTFYCRKSIYVEYGNYKENLSIASDVDLMFRFLEIHRINSCYLDENLVEMKVGGVSTKSLRSTVIITKEVLSSFKENGYNYSYFIYLIGKLLKALRQLKSMNYFK